jgi:hypothetical protein
MSVANLTNNSVFIRNPDLLGADMDGDMVMLSINRGNYYGVNNVGARIWTLLENQISIEEVSHLICSEYAVEHERCQSDLMIFFQEMLENDLVILVK